MIGFTFRGIHSSEYNIAFRSVDRTLIPQKRKKEFTILGRSGTLEIESDEYEKREIKAVIAILNEKDFFQFREKLRTLAGWLSGYGLLIFDDEPDKAYEASIYQAVGIEQLYTTSKALCSITFECQPFAQSVELHRLVESAQSKKYVEVENKGNIATCGVIKIKNLGNTSISTIRIKRKVVIK